MNKFFESMFKESTAVDLKAFLIIMGVSLVLSVIISLVYIFTHKKEGYIPSLALTLIFLTPIISMLMIVIGDSAGRAISVVGAFSLVRFRSAPGDPKDIAYIFFALALGVATGMGYIGFGIVFTVFLCLIMTVLCLTNYAAPKSTAVKLKITVPENLNFNGLFDDLFEKYTTRYTLHRIKTKDFGALYELSYSINIKNDTDPKEMIDAIRCRNGNLEVSYVRTKYSDKIYED